MMLKKKNVSGVSYAIAEFEADHQNKACSVQAVKKCSSNHALEIGKSTYPRREYISCLYIRRIILAKPSQVFVLLLLD